MSGQQQRASDQQQCGVSRSRKGTRYRLLALVAAGTVVGLGGTANAVDTFWSNAGTGAWETGANWSTGLVPGAGDGAFINNAGTAVISTTSGAQSVDKLRVGSGVGNSGTLNISGDGSLNSTNAVYIAGDDDGLGGFVGGSGALNISDNGVLSTTAGYVAIGYNGTATFNMTGGALNSGIGVLFGWRNNNTVTGTQSGGSITSQNNIWMGEGPSNTVNYTMTGGSMSAPGYLLISNNPTTSATFDMQAGNVTPGWLLVGHQGNGTFKLSGGTVTAGTAAAWGSDAFTIAQHPGTSKVEQTGGTLNVRGQVVFSNNITNGPAAATFDLSGGTFNAFNNNATPTQEVSIRVGQRGPAIMKVRGTAVANVGRNLVVGGGFAVQGHGTLEVGDSGELNVGMSASNLAGTLGIGANAEGTFTLSSGTVTADVFLSGYLNTTVSRGQSTQSGGSFTVADYADVGQVSAQSNFYEITAGTLTVNDFADTTPGQLSNPENEGLNVARTSTIGDTPVYSNGRLTIDGTAAVTVDGPLTNSRGWTDGWNPTDGTFAGVLRPGGTGLIEMKGGTLAASSFINGGAANGAGSSASYAQSGGTATLGHVTGTGTVAVSGGTLNVNSLRQASASLSGTALVQLAPDASAAGTSNVGSLSITDNAKLDLTQNKLVTNTPVGTFTGGAYTGVQGDVARAYNFGAWDQPGLMTSEELAGPNAGPLSGTTTIGVATGEQILFIGATDTGVFAGQTITGATTIAMYTYAGDMNFDGLVDAADYGVIDNFVQFPGSDGYANGDLNYDGVIDAGDYGIIDNTIQLQGAPFPGWDASASSASAGLSGVTAVPEPASLSLLAFVAAAGLLHRRRSRRP